MRIGLIGAGALGTEVTLRMACELPQMLAGSTVFLVDPDRVEQRNIPLSRLWHAALEEHGARIVGRSKAEIAAQQLDRQARQHQGAMLSPACRWVPFPVEIADLSWPVLRSLDLLLSCTDNALARLESTLAARSLGLPLLDGGVQGEHVEGGRVAFFSPEREAACYLCGLGEERRAALLTFAAATSLPCTMPAGAALGSDVRVSASLQHTAKVMVEQIRSFGEQLAREPPLPRADSSWAIRLHASEGGQWRRERIALRRSASCPWHTSMRLPLVAVGPDQSFGQALDGVRLPFVPRLQFAWPMCLRAVCRVCGAADRQPRRVALVRRKGVCAHCQTPHQLEPLQAVASVGKNEPMAKMTPRQLGWADPQLFQVRPGLAFANEATEEC